MHSVSAAAAAVLLFLEPVFPCFPIPCQGIVRILSCRGNTGSVHKAFGHPLQSRS